MNDDQRDGTATCQFRVSLNNCLKKPGGGLLHMKCGLSSARTHPWHLKWNRLG